MMNKDQVTKFKFFIKYWWLVLTFRTPLIEHIYKEFTWDSGNPKVFIEVLNISPSAVRELNIIRYNDVLKLTFKYSVNGSEKMAWISLHDILYFGS